MPRIAFASDIHLEFVDVVRRYAFHDELLAAAPDFALLAGDIGTANNVESLLMELDHVLACPLLFVLGNHDFYNGSIESTRRDVALLAKRSAQLRYLTDAGVVPLSEHTAVVGHDGWYDARLGDFANSRLFLNDFRLISELANLPKPMLGDKLRQLGEEAAAAIAVKLREASGRYRQIVIVTHVPPFQEACLHEGRPSDANGLPFFACQALGDVLQQSAQAQPECQFTVLCGHTHSAADVPLMPNLRAIVAGAEYGRPRVDRVLDLP